MISLVGYIRLLSNNYVYTEVILNKPCGQEVKGTDKQSIIHVLNVQYCVRSCRL